MPRRMVAGEARGKRGGRGGRRGREERRGGERRPMEEEKGMTGYRYMEWMKLR